MINLSLRSRFADNPWFTPLAALALGAAAAWLVVAAMDNWQRARPAVGDEALRQRVRQRVGELVTRPDAIHIAVESGVVRLSGDVLPNERDALLAGLIAVPGVSQLRNALGSLSQSA